MLRRPRTSREASGGNSRLRAPRENPSLNAFSSIGAYHPFSGQRMRRCRPGFRAMYFPAVRGEIRIPSLSFNSLDMRSSPQAGFSLAIVRIKSWRSLGTGGGCFRRLDRIRPSPVILKFDLRSTRWRPSHDTLQAFYHGAAGGKAPDVSRYNFGWG